MPLRYAGKAKAHVFLDVSMDECIKPTPLYDVRAGAGCKAVITIGPACQDVPTLIKLLQAGVTCARVDLSWGTKDFHVRSLTNLEEAMQATRRLCSVWLDTTGREVVVRRPVDYDASGWPCIADDKMRVEKDQVVTVTTDPTTVCSATRLPINYPGFPDIVDVGQQLQVGRYLATGAEGVSLYLDVVDRNDTDVTCVATNSATLDGLLNVMVCHTEDEDFRGDFVLPLLTEHDVACIKDLGQQFEVDFISLSFCNCVEDLYATRALLDSLGLNQTKIIAKIERKAAIRNFEAVAHVADGIVISRGNLGLDFDSEVMALLQKRIISRCNALGKPVHITRIVDTMVATPRPTRAEATDVANAVLDGVDGLLLGAETLRGGYPVLTVETVLKLASAAEQHFDYRTHHEILMGEAYDEEVSLGRADVSVADFRMYSGRSPDTTLHPPRRARSFGGGLSRSYGGGGGLSQRTATTSTDDEHGDGTAAGGLVSPVAMQGIGADAKSGAALAAVNVHAAAVGMANGDGTPVTSGAPFGFLQGEHSAGTAEPEAYVSTFGSLPPQLVGSSPQMSRILLTHAPYLSKLESLASSATRTAEKINAGLIIVMVQSGRTVSLVAKYRPPMPIMAVVVPTLKSTRLGWKLEGKYLARQTLTVRGVVPMLAAPMSPGSEDLLSEAIHSAHLQRLVRPNDYVVCIMSHRGQMVVKVVQVNRQGTGLKIMGGLNSTMIGGEEPDIISDRTPFGTYAVLPSPGTARTLGMPPPAPFGGGIGSAGVGMMSPARTLSGRPSPFLSPSAAPAAPPSYMLGGGHMLVSTVSEAQAFDDFFLGEGAVGAGGAAGMPGNVRTATPSRTTTDSPLGSPPAGSGGSSATRGSPLSPITEQPLSTIPEQPSGTSTEQPSINGRSGSGTTGA